MKVTTSISAPSTARPRWRCKLPGWSNYRTVYDPHGRPIVDNLDACAAVFATFAPTGRWTLELTFRGTVTGSWDCEASDAALRAARRPSVRRSTLSPMLAAGVTL